MYSTLHCKSTGGRNATLGQFPYAVQIGFRKKQHPIGRVVYACGGSLINDQHVLTAAHCFLNPQITAVEVVLGEVDVTADPDCIFDVCNPLIQRISISKVIMHPSFSPNRNVPNDIALIRLSTKAVYNVAVQPVCLPLPSDIIDSSGQVVVAGWGQTRHDSSGDLLVR